MTTPTGLGDLAGLWRRSLIAWPDGRRDEATQVFWLQGPSFYADLRVPPARPDFSGATSLNDLDWPQIRWLATQEGFAGSLSFDGTYFEWQREIDFQPLTAIPDAGRLWFADGMLIEEGRYVPYIEYWHRDVIPAPSLSAAASFTSRAKGQNAMLVRAGDWMMLALGRRVVLPNGTSLAECVNAASIEDARVLVDLETSIAASTPDGWRIVKSSLPFREGQTLAVPFAEPDWQFAASEGDISALKI